MVPYVWEHAMFNLLWYQLIVTHPNTLPILGEKPLKTRLIGASLSYPHTSEFSRRTGSMVSEAKLHSTSWQVKKLEVIVLPLFHGAPPLLFTVVSSPVTPTNSLAVPSPSLEVHQCNERDIIIVGATVLQVYVLVHLAQVFILYFAMRWNWQIYHTHQAFKLLLRTFSGKPQTFPTREIKDKWISSWSNPTVHSGFLLENS